MQQENIRKSAAHMLFSRNRLPCTMSLLVASLNSGSNGNCYYIANQHEAVLIDAGISCRETERRMRRLELSLKKVKAIFVSHEHGDHIYGVSTLSKKHRLPVYATPRTLQQGRLNLRSYLTSHFNAHEPVRIGGLTITPFPKLHDACDPHSFIVESNNVRVGIFTDIGAPCQHVINYFRKCHAAFLEANYDEEMLETGSYPIYLKNRIRGGFGHISNKQALQLFIKYRPSFMSHLFLSHLSRENNSPQIVKDLFQSVAGRTEIIVASRDAETALYHIRNLTSNSLRMKQAQMLRSKTQLSLFELGCNVAG